MGNFKEPYAENGALSAEGERGYAMTSTKICPILSRPKNVTALGKVLLFDSMAQINAAGLYTDMNGAQWSGVFYCQEEKCMAYSMRCAMIENGKN
jgi:hypothetical protein